MKERELISSEIVETIGEYTIVKTKERMLDVMFELPYNNETNQIIIEKENIEYNLCQEAIPSA